MFSHIEYMNIPGGPLGLEPVRVLDPMGYVAIAVIIVIAVMVMIIIDQRKKIRIKDEIINEQRRLIRFYYHEDQFK